MSYAYKFTDTHVRKHPALISIAIEYAKQYCGDFEPMLDAQDCLRRTGVLPVAQARKVLNILRQEMDPDVASLQVEAISVLEETKAEREAEIRRSEFKVISPRQQPRPPERPDTITTKVKLHRGYVMVKAKQGAIHIATSAECRWRLPSPWAARHMAEHLRTVRVPELWVYTQCGGSYYGPPPRLILLDEPEAPERRQCVKCFPVEPEPQRGECGSWHRAQS